MGIAVFVWNADPVLLQAGGITVRWYGLLFGTAFVAGLYIVRWMYACENRPVQDIDRLFITMIVGTLAGARLGHVLFYDPAFYFSNPAEIAKIWHGGLASHGGAIGIFAALYLHARRPAAQPYLWLLDRIAVPTALAGFFIRLGNFFNSEILGSPSEAPWAVVFPRFDDVTRHPAQLYEAFGYLAIFSLLLTLYRRRPRPAGMLLAVFLTSVFSFRFFVEFFKMRQASFAAETTLSVGQLLSIPLIVLGIGLLVRAVRTKTIHPSIEVAS